MAQEKIYFNLMTQSFRKGTRIEEHEVVPLLTRDGSVLYHKERDTKTFKITKRIVPKELLE